MERSKNPLEHLGKIKDALTDLFLEDELIRSLIMPVLDDSQLTLKQNWEKHCFNTAIPLSPVTDDRAFLCLETEAVSAIDAALKVQLIINVYACGSMVHMTEEEKQGFISSSCLFGNRIDMAAAAIHRTIMNDEALLRRFGAGRMQLSEEKPVTYLWEDDRYYGKSLSYTIYQMPVRLKRQVV